MASEIIYINPVIAVTITTNDVDIYPHVIEIDNVLTISVDTKPPTILSPGLLPLQTFISQASTRTRKNRLLQVQFGQGFSQFAKDGANSQYDTWRIVYNVLTETQRAELVEFYEEFGCDKWWWWKANGDTNLKKWRIDVDSFNDNSISGDLYNVSFAITQQFDLGATA